MVLVEYNTPEAGMHALMELHNFRDDGNISERGWVVSFTRSRANASHVAGAATVPVTAVASAGSATQVIPTMITGPQ